jgi:hypothetical protein
MAILFNNDRLASGSTDRWEDAQTRNKCRLKLTGPTQYTDLASEIEYPSCILGEKVRMAPFLLIFFIDLLAISSLN